MATADQGIPRTLRGSWMIAALVVASACGDSTPKGEAGTPGDEPSAAPEHVVLKIEGRGEIRIELFPEYAPKHVENFRKLVREEYYTGTRFHRVIPDFMILGGDHLSKDDDPGNDGTGSPGYALEPEPSELKHGRGIVGMSRRSDGKSDGSQFYIMLADSPTWRRVMDGRYTAFGRVVEGIDVAIAVAAVDRNLQDAPLVPQVISAISVVPAIE